MNKSILVGRLTRDPDVRYSQNDNTMAIARFTIAVDRRMKGEQNADFISCIAFGKTAEFVEKYFSKGMKIGLSGRIQTGSYTNKDGVKVYTTDVIAEEVEFVESKGARTEQEALPAGKVDDGFLTDDLDDELSPKLKRWALKH